MKQLSVSTRRRTHFVDITGEVQDAVSALGVADGAVTVFVPHTTAGVTINEHADPDVMRDLGAALERMVPWNAGYAHGEGNAAAHVKASLMGSSVRVPVAGGRLRLGTWQGIFLCEFDGPRERRVWVL
ncbi:MAG: YjbQ family protein [Kiritimatiellae bacterium]|nr:YjbQ family protein [Kiritimatiellia bacterium]